MSRELDLERLVQVGVAEDPITAARWEDLLRTAGLHVENVSHGLGPVDLLTQATRFWWELRVPESEVARAQAILDADAAAKPFSAPRPQSPP